MRAPTAQLAAKGLLCSIHSFRAHVQTRAVVPEVGGPPAFFVF
jgi:hypothetical protein